MSMNYVYLEASFIKKKQGSHSDYKLNEYLFKQYKNKIE